MPRDGITKKFIELAVNTLDFDVPGRINWLSLRANVDQTGNIEWQLPASGPSSSWQVLKMGPGGRMKWGTMPASTLVGGTITGDVVVNGSMQVTDLYVTSDINIGGSVLMDWDVIDTLQVGGNLTAEAHVFVGGSVTVDGHLVIGNTTKPSAGDIDITFGQEPNMKTLHWDAGDGFFQFSDDVDVGGELTVSDGIRVNADGAASAEDATIFFGATWSPETLRWMYSTARFEFGDQLYVNGDLEATGSMIAADVEVTSDITVAGSFLTDISVVGTANVLGISRFEGTVTAAGSMIAADFVATDDITIGGDMNLAGSVLSRLSVVDVLHCESGFTLEGSVLSDLDCTSDIMAAGTLTVLGSVFTAADVWIGGDHASSSNASMYYGSETSHETILWDAGNGMFTFSDNISVTGGAWINGELWCGGAHASSDNASMYFGSVTSQESLTWDSGNSRFQFSDGIYSPGDLTISGVSNTGSMVTDDIVTTRLTTIGSMNFNARSASTANGCADFGGGAEKLYAGPVAATNLVLKGWYRIDRDGMTAYVPYWTE